MQIGDLMEETSTTATTSDDIQATLEIMRAKELSVMPVVDPNGVVAGLIWRSTLLKNLPENAVDEALEETFPASDPISPP